MKKQIFNFTTIAASMLVSGCILVPTSQRTIHKWENRVTKWLPVGTSVEDIKSIMTEHGFKCTGVSGGAMGCDKDTGMNNILVELYILDGKLAAPPTIDVSRSGDM